MQINCRSAAAHTTGLLSAVSKEQQLFFFSILNIWLLIRSLMFDYLVWFDLYFYILFPHNYTVKLLKLETFQFVCVMELNTVIRSFC